MTLIIDPDEMTIWAQLQWGFKNVPKLNCMSAIWTDMHTTSYEITASINEKEIGTRIFIMTSVYR